MNIREAKYLLEIEKTQQLTKAANNLYITQPALSKALKKLESEFGCTLFYRNESLLYPTECGLVVLRSAQRIVDEFRDMCDGLEQIKLRQNAQINLGLPIGGAFLVAPILAQFNEQHPDITINASLHGGKFLMHMLQTGNLDAAFLMPFTHEETKSFRVHVRLYASDMAVGVPFTHPWVEKEYITDQDFDGMPFVCLDTTCQSNAMLVSRFKASGIEPEFKMQSNDFPWLLEYAKAVNAPCVLSEMVLTHYAKESMAIKRFNPSLRWEMNLSTLEETTQSKGTKVFLRFVSEYVRINHTFEE